MAIGHGQWPGHSGHGQWPFTHGRRPWPWPPAMATWPWPFALAMDEAKAMVMALEQIGFVGNIQSSNPSSFSI